MSNKPVLVFLFFLFQLTSSEAQPTFVKSYPVQAESFGKAIVKTYDGHLILGGTTISAGADTGIVLLKVDLLGSVQWSKIMQAPNDEDLVGMISTSDSGLALVSVSLASRSARLIKMDSSGTIQWTKSFYDLYPFSLIQTLDQGYCLSGGGNFPIPGPASLHSKIIKTDFNGDTLWTKTHSDGNHFLDLTQVLQNPDSTYMIAEIYAQIDVGVPWIGKLDKEGHLISKTSPCNSFDEYKDLVFCKTPGSDYIISGDTWEDFIWGHGLMKLDSQLSFKWFKILPVLDGSPTRAMLQTQDGNILLLQENQLVKVDTAGNVIWAQRLVGVASVGKNALLELPDGAIILCGSRYDSTFQTYTMSLSRFDSSGFNCLSDPLAISYLDSIRPHSQDTLSNEIYFDYILFADSISTVPAAISEQTNCFQYTLIKESVWRGNLHLFPNPTTGKFLVNSSEFGEKLNIEIFSTLGSKVMAVSLQTMNSALPTEVDISLLPSGIYIVQAVDAVKVWRGKVVKE